MKKLLAILLTLVLLLPVAAEDTLVEWIPFDDEGTLFLRYDTYRDYYVLTDRDGKRVEGDSFYAFEYAFEDWTYENILVVAWEGKYGYFDKDSGWIVQPQFDFAHYFQDNGLAAVKKDGLWGFINREGEVVFEPQFDAYEEDEYLSWYEEYKFCDHIAAVCRDGLWGYVRDDGTVLMEPQFDDAGQFGYGNGLTWVKKDGLYGIVNRSGELLLAPQFDEVKMRDIDSGIVPVMKGGLWGYITLEGKWLFEPQFAYADYFDDRFGVAVVEKAGWVSWQGLVSREGEVLIEPRFSTIYSFDKNGIADVAISRKWGFIRADGSVIAEPQFDYMWHSFSEGACAVEKDGLLGFIDENGDWLTGLSYERTGDFHEGLAAVCKDGLWGYIDKRGEYVIEPRYYSAGSFEGGIARVKAAGNDAYGLIDREGNVLLDTVNQWIERTDDGVYEVNTGNGWKDYALIGGVLQEISTVSNELYLRDYYPNEGEKVAVLSEKADIIWDESAALPRLDGAKALVPVYAAFVQATYPEDTRLKDTDYSWIVPETQVAYTNTVSAYERLMHGETDMIFCAGPSQAEVEDAAKLGVEFELTCMGYEAFVFIVNADNPLENISVDQIRGVYSGEITSWDALGVEGIGDIIAYQRNKNSGSQTTLEKLMGDTPLMEAPQMYVSDGMEDILTTIEYRNFPNAISFTFRFFCKDMIGSSVKMLAIDGVAPTEENIRNGSYPLITPVYAVTRKGETNPNVQILLDWITGSQGQELVEKSGYVGVN